MLRLEGHWQLGQCPVPAEDVEAQLGDGAGVRGVTFDTSALAAWDTGLLVFLVRVVEYCAARGIDVDQSGLPDGVRGLLALARAVPGREGADRAQPRESFLVEVGTQSIALWRSAGDILRFIGGTTIAAHRVISGRARMPWSDLFLFMQQTGANALPIVSLISFLVGLILAYIGAAQLEQFGAKIYVADLVSLAMSREMAAMMTAIILAGRTGAAFAAQLGTMTVNEEIDALKTLGISPVEFLVVPRVVALALMTPLLALYAMLLGNLGGAFAAMAIFDISPIEYYVETTLTLGVMDIGGGLVKAFVYGIIVAISGCMRGMQCGRSAAAVGYAATSAVVTAIVFMVIAAAGLTVLYDVLGI